MKFLSKNIANKAELVRLLSRPLSFRLFTRVAVPAARHAKVRFGHLNDESCSIEVPMLKRNRNPFRSMYFAVQSMAAEMSTALLAMYYMTERKESIAWIVTDLQADFPSKAISDVTFTCKDGLAISDTIEEAIRTKEARQVEAVAVGTLADGTVVSTFRITWSFKVRQ